jgi:hypothetical protein
VPCRLARPTINQQPRCAYLGKAFRPIAASSIAPSVRRPTRPPQYSTVPPRRLAHSAKAFPPCPPTLGSRVATCGSTLCAAALFALQVIEHLKTMNMEDEETVAVRRRAGRGVENGCYPFRVGLQ